MPALSAVATTALAQLRRLLLERRTALALGGLDDRMLSDIGLHRSEVASIAHRGEADTTRVPR